MTNEFVFKIRSTTETLNNDQWNSGKNNENRTDQHTTDNSRKSIVKIQRKIRMTTITLRKILKTNNEIDQRSDEKKQTGETVKAALKMRNRRYWTR